MPANQTEVHAAGELIRRIREKDPAIRPILKQLDTLLKQRIIEEERERQKEIERYRGRGSQLKRTREELREYERNRK